MKKVTQFDLNKYFVLPNPGLTSYFGRVVEGSNVDIRPPYWNGKSRQQVISAWDDQIAGSDAYSKVPGLQAFEEEMRGKIGPLSIMESLRERIPSIEEYYEDVKLPSQPIDDRAVQEVLALVKRVQCRIASPQYTVSQMKLSTSSGAPYFRRKRNMVDLTLSNLKDVTYLPAILGWRGQEGGPTDEDVKQRVVWMFPFGLSIRELSAYQGLIKQWQSYQINSAYISQRAVEEKITRLFDSKGDNYCIVTDFHRFDQHFNSDLQNAAKIIVSRQLTNSPESRIWMEEVFSYKYDIPIICSPQLMYTGHHGMGSGSGGTNFDECCAHAALQHEVAILHGQRLNPFSNAYGDDGYLSYEGIDVDDVISAYESHGQVMNPDKQSADKHSAVYLRRYYHDSYRDGQGIMLGIYSTFRALGRLLGQERYVDFEEGSKDYARYLVLRALSIVENCNQHPLFYKFVDFVISGDKYKLGLGLPGFLDSLPKQVQKLTEADPDLLGYTKTLQGVVGGIEDWKVVKYLRSKQ